MNDGYIHPFHFLSVECFMYLQQNIEVKDNFFKKKNNGNLRIKSQTNIIEHQNQPSHYECVLTIAAVMTISIWTTTVCCYLMLILTLTDNQQIVREWWFPYYWNKYITTTTTTTTTYSQLIVEQQSKCSSSNDFEQTHWRTKRLKNLQ